MNTHSDRIVLEPKIAAELHGRRRGRNPGLSARELEVMQEVANGLNDREISQRLHITIDTAKVHLKQVYQKLSVHSRTRAAISLVLMGLVSAPCRCCRCRVERADLQAPRCWGYAKAASPPLIPIPHGCSNGAAVLR